MLLFDDTKKLEKALGPEAAEVLAKLFESQDEAMRKDLATKADLAREMAATKADLELKLAETKIEIIKWVAGLLLAQTALLAALMKLMVH